jgi:hypothetical protein
MNCSSRRGLGESEAQKCFGLDIECASLRCLSVRKWESCRAAVRLRNTALACCVTAILVSGTRDPVGVTTSGTQFHQALRVNTEKAADLGDFLLCGYDAQVFRRCIVPPSLGPKSLG